MIPLGHRSFLTQAKSLQSLLQQSCLQSLRSENKELFRSLVDERINECIGQISGSERNLLHLNRNDHGRNERIPKVFLRFSFR